MSAMPPTPTGFDYTALDPEVRMLAQRNAGEIKVKMGRAFQDIIDMGDMLLETKRALPHGQFGGWLEAEFDMSESAALKMMQVAAAFKSVIVTDLPIGATALYLLAAPSTPVSAREEALARAAAGQRITTGTAQAIAQRHSGDGREPDIHPYNKMFPMLNNEQMLVFMQGIKRHGLLHPIVIDPHGQVLDGKIRLLACKLTGVPPRFEVYTGDDQVEYIMRANIDRQHLHKREIEAIAQRFEALNPEWAREIRASVVFGYDDEKPLDLRGFDPLALPPGFPAPDLDLEDDDLEGLADVAEALDN
jgi:hypothetical protein